jgi:hypothetical protein
VDLLSPVPVLLLHLARKQADEFEVSALPVFSAVALAAAMTQLSGLSFSEVVNDFKVASSFVLTAEQTSSRLSPSDP